MTTATDAQLEQTVRVADGTMFYRQKGSGAPLVVLHHSIGTHGWLPLYERLAERYTVYAPDMPGFGKSERPVWARNPRDLAILIQQFMDALGLDGVTLIGCGFGGWIAAEVATMNQRGLAQLVLVGAAGLQPREGNITDQVIVDYVDYVRLGFYDAAAFDQHFGEDPPVPTRMELYGGREMTIRVTWKPWMFSRALPHLLRGVRTAALVVWGEHDRIVPLDVGKQYVELLQNARLVQIEGAGHFLDFERPDALAAVLLEASVGAGSSR